MPRALLLTATLACLAFLTCTAEPPATGLVDGHYTLTFTNLTLLIGTPKEKETAQAPDVKLPAVLKTQDSDITIDTTAPDGTPLKFHGCIKDNVIYLWVSALERDHIVTQHLTGALTSDHAASGDASFFTSHEKAAACKWALTADK